MWAGRKRGRGAQIYLQLMATAPAAQINICDNVFSFDVKLSSRLCVLMTLWGSTCVCGIFIGEPSTQQVDGGVGEGLGVRFCLGFVNYIGIDVCSVALSPFCPAPIVSQLLQTKCLLTSDAPPKQVSCEEV